MRKIWRITGWIVLILIAGAVAAWFGFLRPEPPPISEYDRSRITVMPLPAKLKLHQEDFDLSNLQGYEFHGVNTPRMERAVKRFYNNISGFTGLESEPGEKKQLVLKCLKSSGAVPLPGDDESYSLRISKNRIILKAPQETGILHGLETILQLLQVENGKGSLPQLTLQDKPRYPWRGLMIDASRHWIPKEVILRNLDGMAMVKMNVLHWHLTDYQAFRVESRVFPKLHEKGSGGNFYTQEQIREVVAYAADRGIRVIPEFDLPGHATSWFAGYPELASAPGPYVPDTIFGILEPLMDPTREEVYDFLDSFVEEMSTLFPDPTFHIGGDEVATRQWDENTRIRQFMTQHGLEDARALQAYFNDRLHAILKSHGKRMMGWDEIIHPDLPAEGTIVQSWRNHSSLWEAARSGYGAVLSSGYYLDHKKPAGFHYRIDPAVIPGAVTIEIDSSNWKSWDCALRMNDMVMDGELYLFGAGETLRGIIKFMEGVNGFTDATLSKGNLFFTIDSDYGKVKFEAGLENDSLVGTASISFLKLEMRGKRSGGSDMEAGKSLPDFRKIEPLTPDQQSRLLGGEACIWSEMVNGTTLESRVWPRAAAVAEKLWSPEALTTDEEDMYRRLILLDDKLDSKGLRHNRYREAMIHAWAGESDPEVLLDFILLLEEDQFFNRIVLYDPQLYTYTPLDRVVDAAPAESYRAYLFGESVNRWLEKGNQADGKELREIFKSWKEMPHQLGPALKTSTELQEVEPHVFHLSALSDLGLAALEGLPSPLNSDQRQELYKKAKRAYGGTILSVVEAVQKLVESETVK